MRPIAFLLIAVAMVAGVVATMIPASGQADGDAAPIYGIKIPPGYRDWRLISVNHLAGGSVKQVRAQLGNDIAMKAFQEGKLPFPDGAIIAALHWNEALSDENNSVLASGFPGAGLQSFVAGSAVNVQFMIKDSKQYAATNLTVTAEDLVVTLESGSVFVAPTEAGVTGLVLLGRGEMRFRPRLDTERVQVKIFCGSDTLVARFDAAFLRIDPSDAGRVVASDALVPRPVDARDLRKANEVFA